MAHAWRDLPAAGCLLLCYRLLYLWPADADRHGGGGMFAQGCRRSGDRFRRSVCLSRGGTVRLPDCPHHGNVALERFLPGDKDAKLAPYTAAIYDNMYRLYSKDKIDKEIADGNIEVIPLAFMRGRNLTNCCVVVDEGQNITHRQMELVLGRICHGSRMIICGDTAQIDLKDKKISGFNFISTNFRDVPGFAVVTLKTNHRDPIVEHILEIYKAHD